MQLLTGHYCIQHIRFLIFEVIGCKQWSLQSQVWVNIICENVESLNC